VVRAQSSSDNAEEGTSRRSLLGASVALSAAAGVLPQLALPTAARANTVLSSDWEQVRRPALMGVQSDRPDQSLPSAIGDARRLDVL
jgi:hypothetical protein